MICVFSLAAALVALSCPAFTAAGQEPAHNDLDRFQGTWILRSMESEGDTVPPEHFEGWKAVYEGNALTLKAGDEVRRRCIITLNPARKPKAINTWDQEGPYEDQTVPGIYKIEGDKLTLCFARPNQPRPTEFSSKQGGGFLLLVYERKKP